TVIVWIIIHGSQLTLDLPERTQRLKFVSADESDKFTIWEHKSSSLSPSKPSKGQVSSASNGWTFRIQHVTFDDQGTYTLLNQSGSTIASYILKVNVRTAERIIGTTLPSIQELYLSRVSKRAGKITLDPSHPAHSLFELLPSGRRYRLILILILILTCISTSLDVCSSLFSPNIYVDQHKFTPNKRLIALLLLVIPVGICFCCKKRICKSCQTTKSNTHTNESNTTPVSIAYSNTVTAPVGPGDPGQNNLGAVAGHPKCIKNQFCAFCLFKGFHPESVPQNPVYPPNFGPGLPPAQPPQWNAPPTQYNPSAPVVHLKSFANVFAFHPACLDFYVLICNTKIASKCNYMPAKNSAPPGPDTTGLNMNELPPTAPLLTPQLESQPSAMSSISMMNMLKSSDSGVQFDNNKGKSSGSNFL
uniref:Wu:fc21g02 n=1 Tax=Cyprinus carpio TaxID=7962 RepID=A0A8C1PL03_CYPCA